MDPAGNSCPNDGTDCTLGTMEECVQVPSGGGPVEFDVFLDNLPSGDSILGFRYHIGEKHDNVLGPITAITEQNPDVNLTEQPGSSTLGFSDPVGTLVPSFYASVAELGAPEYNPPYTQGTLGRYTLDTTGLADGIYGLTLDTVILGSEVSSDLCVLYSCDIWDANATPEPYGLIAIGQSCPPAPTPTATPAAVGGIAELPDASDSSAPNYVAVAGGIAAAFAALSTGAWYARRRWLR